MGLLLIRDPGSTKPYDLALVTTDLTTPLAGIVTGTPGAGALKCCLRSSSRSSEQARPATGYDARS
ncbi:hypothetical protein [Actinacidiphila oryziradicis]|uniref:Uncharacterized protein n=1 Tax=Actinacidiphila oryziradicis TaxID=2571141 RepID=A0A4U0RXB7_9ACTN|nr:hypothetical protein [Actinacidiphila oryziradicis]TKA00273.1 hypothetical protein FCI23_43180 [Actinacidiphila oryziradicis]